MSVHQEISRGPGARRRADVGRPAGLTMPQALVISTVFTVVLVLAVVLRLHGISMTESLQMLGGAAGIGVVVVCTVTPGGRGQAAAMVRAALHAGR
ncbi:hypothetical protein [Streptomyces sp. NPDC096339]|uniref:hypothetical protein n=1 Tax=Streptomyces sp. NPDC096339 TaxID=3366086 RepID=UPI0038021E75